MQPIGIPILFIFIGTYLAISSEKVNRTAMAMTGMGLAGLALWVAHSIDPSQGATFTHLVETIEWQTLLFVTAMMVIVAIAGQSGMFQYIALNLARPSGGDTKRIFITFIVFVFFVSLFFDTSSTMLIIAPLTIEICKALEIDFKPYLIAESITANFASVPSLVGAVPNLVIAGETGMDAGLLFLTLMPLSIILLLVTLPILLKLFEDTMIETDSELIEEIFDVNPEVMINCRTDFFTSLIGLGILVLGFTWGVTINLEPALVAVLIGFGLLLLAHERVERIMSQVSWSTIFFLVGVFGLVGALEIVGFIDELGEAVHILVADNTGIAVVFLTWVPAALSAVIDNIPVAVVLAPIAESFAASSAIFPIVLIYAVNVGGYLLPMGAPANILAIALSEKHKDPISFAMFAKVASMIAVLHLLIGTGWLLLMSILI